MCSQAVSKGIGGFKVRLIIVPNLPELLGFVFLGDFLLSTPKFGWSLGGSSQLVSFLFVFVGDFLRIRSNGSHHHFLNHHHYTPVIKHSWLENGPFEDAFPIKMVIFHCYVSLPEGTRSLLVRPEFVLPSILKVGGLVIVILVYHWIAPEKWMVGRQAFPIGFR